MEDLFVVILDMENFIVVHQIKSTDGDQLSTFSFLAEELFTHQLVNSSSHMCLDHCPSGCNQWHVYVDQSLVPDSQCPAVDTVNGHLKYQMV